MSLTPVREEELIRARPLLFESRPFTRLVKRCHSLIPPPPTEKPAPKPVAPALLPTHEEIDLDFAHFTSVLTRIQLVLTTNAAEITRYSSEAQNIASACETARQELVQLREELTAAQLEKANRLVYDEIAQDILNTRGLRPRAEQEASCERLEAEIAELEAERVQYEELWTARRAQFEAIVKQLELMWAQIKEEKEEQERREGMSEDEEEGETQESSSGKAVGVAGSGNTPLPVREEEETEAGEVVEGEEEKEEGEETDDVDIGDAPGIKSRQRESGEVRDADRMDTS